MAFQDQNKNQPGMWAWNRTKYTYDDNGNTTGDGVHSYLYDAAGRLATVKDGATEKATYIYDGDNRRVAKTVNGATTFYFYDRAGRLLTELLPGTTSGTADGKDYVYLSGEPLARLDWSVQDISSVLRAYKSVSNVRLDWTSYGPTTGNYVVRRKQVIDPNDKTFDGATTIATVGGGTKMYDDPIDGLGNRYDYVVFKQVGADARFFYHTDHLGTPIAMTDGSSALVWKPEYRPFGDVDSFTYSTITNNLRFPGQYFDAETGLHQNWFRDYDPKTGRYREADPIGLRGGLNLFGYVNSNPIAAIDPLGLAVWICSRKTSVGVFNHAYLWDDRSSILPDERACGQGTNNNHELGPQAPGMPPGWGDQCTLIPGSDGNEDRLMQCCKGRRTKGMWKPFRNDCHKVAGDCIDAIGLPNPGAPGGRFGKPCDSCDSEETGVP